MLAVSGIYPVYATVENGALTQNSVEWCEEVYPQYSTLGLSWFLENYHYSIEARVCGSLYEDSIWEYDGDDRVQKLVERSRYYVELEIKESEDEAQSGQIDITPAGISEKTNSITQTSLDGTVLVIIQTTDATADKYLGMDVTFKDPSGKQIPHVNYDLKVTQEGNDVLILKSQHAETGMVEHWTRQLSSDMPVDIEVKLLGIGLPKDSESWTGPSGEILSFYAVPEFGTLVFTILVVSILSVIVLTKSVLIRKL